MPTSAAAVNVSHSSSAASKSRDGVTARDELGAPAAHVDVGERRAREVGDRPAIGVGDGHQHEPVAVEHEHRVAHRAGRGQRGDTADRRAHRDRHEAVAGEHRCEGVERRVRADGREQPRRHLRLEDGRGRRRPAELLGDEREVDERRAPAAGRFGDGHREGTGAEQLAPQAGVEAAGLRGAHLFR